MSILRITLTGYLLTFIRPATLFRYSSIPHDSASFPLGIQWLSGVYSTDPELITLVLIVFYLTGLASFLGIGTRVSLVAYFVSALYLLTLPQLHGKINHYHHLIWFLFILTLSPCGDRLAFDNWMFANDNNPTREKSVKYGLPIRICWLLIGLIYFFPGFWKLWESGSAWIIGDQLKYILYQKWYQVGTVPELIRIDGFPVLLRLGALFTIVFEIGFIVALFNPLSRLLFIVLGILFHSLTFVFLSISFLSLLVCYVVFFDWEKLRSESPVFKKIRGWLQLSSQQSSDSEPGEADTGVSLQPLLAGAVILVSANLLMGLTQTVQAWPFTSYPTFATRRAETFWTLEIEYGDQSDPVRLSERRMRKILGRRPERFRARLRSFFESDDLDEFKQKAFVLVNQLRKHGSEFEGVSRVEINTVKLRLDPDENNVIRRNHVMTIFLPKH